MLRKLWYKIRIWPWRYNPFFSPSLHLIELAKLFNKGFYEGYARGVKRATDWSQKD